jgi:plasmid stability protein
MKILDKLQWYHYNTSMKSIHIRNIDSRDIESLKRLAARHNRSLQGELLVILRNAALMAPPEQNKINLKTVKIGGVGSGSGTGNWSREDIYNDDGR